MGDLNTASVLEKVANEPTEKVAPHTRQFEEVATQEDNLIYDGTEEPEIRIRTWVALAAMFLLNFVQIFALFSPPAVLTYIEASLTQPQATQAGTWVPNSLSLVQAVICPVLSSASDTFQARKPLLLATSLLAFVGAAIAPGSTSIYRLIGAQTLIGFGFASLPLAYAIPSEILPRRWRPLAQAFNNVAAGLGACSGPLIIGAFTRRDIVNGWRNFYWVQMALWGLTAAAIFAGYRPPKRHTRLDHLSFAQKLGRLDLPGFSLLTIGLTLLLVGLNLGGGLYAWTNARVIATIVIGILILIGFGFYEWKGTTQGILHHDLFRGGKAAGRTFALCVGLIFLEGIMVFSYVIFYPTVETELYESDPFLLTARLQPFWIACMITTVMFGFWSSRFRTIRAPMFVGFLLFTAGIIGLATLQPQDSTASLAFAALAGVGFGAPLILIVSGVQLSTPHHLIATATAVITSSRAVAATTFTAIYAAAFTTRLDTRLPDYVAAAAAKAGLPASSIEAFVKAFAAKNTAALGQVPGVNPSIIGAAAVALKQAFADSLRVIFIIAAPFGVVACIGCFFLGDLQRTMDYRVEAPVEDLRGKHNSASRRAGAQVAMA